MIDFYKDLDETSDGITAKLLKVLDENELRVENLVSYDADNASINYGKHHSVFENLKFKQPRLFKANCNCHVLHNVTKNAHKQLKYDVESLVMKVYNEFSSFAKRLDKLKSSYEFVGEEFDITLRHVPIRWLSLEPAVARLLKCWRAIKKTLFKKAKETHKLIWSCIKDHENGLLDNEELSIPECYIHFVHSFMQNFTSAIKQFESGTMYITRLYSIV